MLANTKAFLKSWGRGAMTSEQNGYFVSEEEMSDLLRALYKAPYEISAPIVGTLSRCRKIKALFDAPAEKDNPAEKEPVVEKALPPEACE